MTAIADIQQVIHELNRIIADCENRNSRQGYFAALYKCMTEAVAEGIRMKMFEDAVRMEKLDVIFASRYLDAWNCYKQQLGCSKSWQYAFDACDDKSLIVLQHLLLGINTHINLDLAIAASLTAPGDNIYALQKDFEMINTLIAKLTGSVQVKLEKIWWPMKLLRRLANGRDTSVINFSITAARKASWANAVALALVQGQASDNYIEQVDTTVLTIAQRIISPQWYKKLLLRVISWFEEKDVRKVIGFIK